MPARQLAHANNTFQESVTKTRNLAPTNIPKYDLPVILQHDARSRQGYLDKTFFSYLPIVFGATSSGTHMWYMLL